MASIITGLFKSQSQAAGIATDLENAGFENSDFITYLHSEEVTKEIKTSIWQYFFKDKTKLEDDSLVVSVRVKSPEAIETAKAIFNDHECVHQNFFENIKFRDAKSLDYLKRIVSLRAKAEIHSPLNVKYRGQSAGINSEVLFGKTE